MNPIIVTVYKDVFNFQLFPEEAICWMPGSYALRRQDGYYLIGENHSNSDFINYMIEKDLPISFVCSKSDGSSLPILKIK